MERCCNVCQVLQPLDNFHNCKSFPLGKVYTCKTCAKAKTQAWTKANSQRKKENSQRHYNENRASYVERTLAAGWAKKNRTRMNEKARQRYWKDRANHVAKLALRRACKFQATPRWLDTDQLKQIRDVYQQAHHLTQETGVLHHVDHIIPLNSPVVCGLHVPWNLRPLPATDNLVKGNRIPTEVFGY